MDLKNQSLPWSQHQDTVITYELDQNHHSAINEVEIKD